MRKKARIEKTHIAAVPARPDFRAQLLKGTALTASLLAVVLSVTTNKAYANPEGGTVVVGDATITPIDGGDIVNIDQGSDRIVIDWTSFSIDEGETVNFNQSSSQALALNRVTGFETSYINGMLTADGYVFLINQNGIVFGRTAFVDVGGLVASTADITNENFMAGNFDFNIASPNEFASIINEGTISIASTGLGALVAPSVRNSGIISANMGSVGLAGARTFTLDFYGDGLFSFDTGAEVIVAPGDGGALVENTGVITADGGHIAITALAAENIVNNVINLDGVVEANSVGVENGTIVLSGGDHGSVNVSGTVSATGDDAGEAGGTIHVLGDNVVIDTGAVVDASGHSGGGDIRIGGGLRGGEGLQVASTTTVRTNAEIRADATHSGDGGTVVLWANDQTRYEGAISARGGAASGDGGFVEVSADDEVLFLAGVDVGADNGNAGALLIDPNNFTVTASVSAALTATLDTGADISIEADNDVFIENDVDGSASAVSGGGIDVSSGRSTSISAGVTLATNDGDITVTVNDDARNGNNRAGGTATFTNNGIIDSNGGNVTIQNGSLSATADVDFALGAIASDGGVIAVNNTVDDITINTGTLDGGGGNISVTASGDIFVGDGAGTAVDASAGGNVLLSATGNIIDSGGGAVINMSGGGALTMNAGGSVGSGNAIDTSGAFTLDGSAGGSFYVSNSGGDLTLGDIDSGGFIDIYNLGNGVLSQGALNATTSYVYIAASSLTVTGAIDAALINLDTNAIDIQATLTAENIDIDPTGGGVTASLNGAGGLDLTNAELAFLDATGTVSIGTDVNPTSFHVGTATVISSATFDLTIETSGDVTFDDSDVALSLSTAQALVINADNIVGGGAQPDIAFSGSGTADLSFDVVNTATIDLMSNVVISGTSGGDITLSNAGYMYIDHLEGDNIDVTTSGNLDIATGTIESGGDLTLTSGATITVGLSAGVAIDASGDVRLDAASNIVDGGGIIEMSGGTLTLEAGGSVGSSADRIQTSGTFAVQGTASNGFFGVDNVGSGTLTVLNVSATGGVRIDSGDGLDITGDVTGGGQVRLGAGGVETLTISGEVTSSDADVRLSGGDIDIEATVSASTTIFISNAAFGDISLNGTAAFDLDNTEIGLLDAGDRVFVGGGVTDELHIGNGTDFSGGTYDVELDANSVVFDDAGTALTIGVAQDLKISADDVTGGGVNLDIAFSGVGTGQFDFEATNTVSFNLLGDVSVDGTAGGAVDLIVDGDLNIEHLEGAGISTSATGDIDIETGTLVAVGDVVLTSNMTITVGSSAGVAIDASGGVYDITLDAGINILDGGGIIDMSGGGTLTLEADRSVGADGAPILTSGLNHLFGSAGDGDFYLDNTGGTTGTVRVVSASATGTATGDVVISTDADLSIADIVSADGNVDIHADGGMGVAGSVSAGLTGTLSADGDGVFFVSGIFHAGTDAHIVAATGEIFFTGTSSVLANSGIMLDAGSSITIDGVSSLNAGLLLTAETDGGDIFIDAGASAVAVFGTASFDSMGGDIEIGGTAGGLMGATFSADTGNFVLNASGFIGGSTTHIIADTVDISGSVSATDVILEPFTDGTTIGLGLGTGTFQLSEAEFDNISADNLFIGNTLSGDVRVEDLDILGNGFANLTLRGDNLLFTDSSALFSDADTVVVDAASSITGSGAGDQIILLGTNGFAFEAGGSVDLSVHADEIAGTAMGSINLALGEYVVEVGSVSSYDGLTSVNGSITLTKDGGSGIEVTEAVSAADNVLIDVHTAGITITAAISAGDTATFISDNISISATVTAADAFLETDTAGTSIGINNATGTFNLTEAELQNLSVSGTVTIGTTQSGDIGIGGLGNSDLSGEAFDLVLIGGTLTIDDDNVGLTLAEGSKLTLDLSGSLSGGGANVDFAWGGIVTSGFFDFATDETATVLTSQVGTLDGTASGAIAFENSGPGTLNLNSLVSSGAGVVVTNSGNVVVETGTLGAASDIAMDVTGDITVGDGAGEAIDATAGGDVTLTATGSILDGGGHIAMGGGTLTIEAGAGVGTDANHIDTVDLSDLNASAGGGGVYIDNTGGTTVTVHSGSATAGGGDAGNFALDNDDQDIVLDGFVNIDGTATFDAGTGAFSNGGAGSISAGLDVTITADVVGIGATTSADNITLQATTPGQTVGLSNGSGTFNLTNAEMDLLDTTGLVTVGRANGTGDIFIGGAGTFALDDNDYDFLLRGGDAYFSDLNTAMQIGGDQLLTFETGSLNGGGTELDISYIGGGGTLSGTTDGIVLNTSGLQTLTMVVSGNFELTNVGDLDIDQLRVTGGTIKVDNTGDVEVETGTLVAGGDVVLTVSQTLTIGDASGVAIDASGGLYDIRLDVGLDIVDGDGIIDMSGGGTLTMDAGRSVGSLASGIQTSGAMFIDGSADDGVFHVTNSGGNTVTVGDITQNQLVLDGQIDIENDDADIWVSGGVLSDGAANFDAGTGEFWVQSGGAVTASSSIDVVADRIELEGTLSAGVVSASPSTSTVLVGLNNVAGSFSLVNSEFDFIDADLVRIGNATFDGDILIGSGGTLDLSDNPFDVEIFGGDVTFADNNVAILMGEGQSLSLGKVGGDSVATVSGGGILTDVAWDGTATADLEFNADGDVTLLTDGDLILNGVSGQQIAFTNSGTLSIDHLESTGGSIDVTNVGDTTVETGTIIVFDTLTMDVTGDLVIGDGGGVAINATTAQDVILTASGSIIDGEGIIDLGGSAALQMDAGGFVGTRDDSIKLSGGTTVSGSSDNGSFSISNVGGSTLLLSGITASTGLSGTGDVFVDNADANIRVVAPLDADGSIELEAGSGVFSTTGTGEVTAGGGILVVASDVEIQTTISAGGSINLEPNTVGSSIGLNNTTGTFNISEAEFQFLDTDDVVFVGAISGTGAIDVAGLGTIDLTGEGYSLVLEGGDLTFDDDQTGIMMAAGEVFAAQVDNLNGGGDEFDVTFPDAGGGNPDGAFLFSASGSVTAYVSAGQIMGAAQGDINMTNSGNVEIGSITLGSGTDTFTVSGLVSGASIDLDVESDLLVTAAVSAQGNVDIDVGDGAFTNSGAGTVDSAAGHVEIIADTVNIGASISAMLSTVNLIPFSAGRTIGLGSAAGDFNLTDAEFALLDAVGVQVGTSTAGAVTIGDVETIDLTDEAYHLSLFTGGSVDFSDDRVGLSLAENKTAEFRVGSIGGGGAVSDIVFESATGTVIFEADAGDVVLRTEASRMGGSATGDITVDNIGDLAISALGADSGLRSGATISVTVHSDLVVSEAVTATGNVTLDAGTGDFSNSGAGTVFAGGDLLVNADTVALGAVMTADNITIQPETAGQTIGLNDASGALNLTEAELQLLASTGDVTIGVANGSGAITIGGLGGIDLTAETYDLVLRGGGVSFADNGATATLGLHGGEFLIDGGPITGGGLDVAFTGADGAIGFTSTGAVTLVTEASLVAGDAAGSIDLDNTGDLEVGTVRNLDGLQSGGSITVEVHSDLNVTQAIHATNDITLDANTNNFSNSGAGTVISDDDVVIEADTVSLGALVQGDNIDLRPNSDAQTVGLSHASGTFNLTNAELDHLSSAGTLTIGRETGTGDIFVGSLGTVDLSDETFDLTIQGGPLLFGGSDPSLLLAENSTLTLNVQHILSGTGLDVAFVNSNGGILFDVTDFATIYVDSSEIAGTIGAGGMNFGNAGDLTIGTVGGFSGLTLNGGTGILTGGTFTIADDLTLNADAALIAGNDFVLDGGDIDATSGPRLFSIESQGGSIRSVDGSLLMAGGASVWLNAATGVDIDTQGVGTTTFTLGGVTDAGDFDVINTVGGNVSVGTVTGIGSGITINNAPGAGGDDILVTNEGHGGAIFINADINTADSMGFSADGSVILNAGHTINSTQGGFIAMRSLFNDVQIDGVINATGTGNVMLSGESGIGGTGKIKLAGNGLGLVAETGGIDVSTEGTAGSTFTVAASVATSGDIDIENSSGGDILIDEVEVSDVGDTGVVVTATNMTTPDGDIFVGNFAGSATGGNIELAGGASIFAGAITSSGNVTLDSSNSGIVVGAGAGVTGTVSVSFSAAMDIAIGDNAEVVSGGPLSFTAGGSITTGDSSEARADGLVLFDAVDNIEIGQTATVSAGGTLTLDSSAGSIDLLRNSTATGATGLIFSADQRIDVRNGSYIGSDARLRFTAGAGISLFDNSTVTSSGSGTITGEGLILIGTGATVHSDTALEITSNTDGVTASTTATITGGTSVAINASTDIVLEGTSFVGAPDIKFDAGNDINTQVGSEVEGTNTILFDAGNDIITNGTTDASTGGVAVTLLAGNDITDGGNTFLFTDGTLRADAGGNIDLTLSGTGGATVTAALNAGGNVDLFLRDGGDLTIDEVTSGGGTTTGVTAGTGYVDLSLEDGLLTVNEDITAANTASGDVTLTADDMEIFSTVTAGVDIFIEPFTDGRGIALNDPTTATLNLTNAEIAFLTTPNTVQFGRTGAGDIFLGGSGSVDFTTNNWNKVRFFTDSTIFMTNGVESQDLENLFDTNVVLTGASVIDTVNAGTGGDVHVTGTIEGTTDGGQSLTITSGAADIIFDSKVGQATPLGALDLSGTDITVTDIATIGTQTYAALGEVTFGSDYTTYGYAFDLSGGLTLADDVLVDTTIPAGTGANITIDDVTNNGYTLTLNAGNNGFITLDTWTNTGAFDGMGTLRILDSGTTTFNSTVSGDTLEVVDTTTLVSLLGDVDLNTLLFGVGPYEVNITGSNVFLVDQVQFNNTGGTTLGNSTSDVFVFGGGAEANASNVNVFGDFTFGGTGIVAASLSLGGDVLFDTAGGNMNIGAVAGNGFMFTLDAGNGGDINLGSFTNPNGGGQTGVLNIINADMLTVTGDINAATFDIDTLQTSGEVQGMVTVDNLIVGPGGYAFSLLGGALVTNFVEFLNTGGVMIGDEDTDLHQFLGGATSTASETTVAGTIQGQGASFTFGDLILYDDTTIDSTLNTPAGQDINFNGTIDSAPSTAHNLVVLAGHGSTATFTGNVGDTTPIGSLNVSALEIILHDVTTVGEQIYAAFDSIGRLGRIELNSSYVTMGGDVDMNGQVTIADNALVDTTYGGEYTSGNIFFGGNGGSISFADPNGTLTLMSGGSTTVRGRFAGSLAANNSATIFARENISLAGGRLGNELYLHAGAFDGDLVANPLGNITTTGDMTVQNFTSMTATGDITFLDEFNTYALRILLNGLASSTKLSPVNVTEIFEIAGLTFGLGASDIWGSIRGSDTESASALGDQLELVRRDDFLFNDCIVEVGCLNFDPSAIVIPVFDPVIYLYERDGDVQELRYSDLPNTEIWFGYGGAPDIWEERLGRTDDDEEDEEGGE